MEGVLRRFCLFQTQEGRPQGTQERLVVGLLHLGLGSACRRWVCRWNAEDVSSGETASGDWQPATSPHSWQDDASKHGQSPAFRTACFTLPAGALNPCRGGAERPGGEAAAQHDGTCGAAGPGGSRREAPLVLLPHCGGVALLCSRLASLFQTATQIALLPFRMHAPAAPLHHQLHPLDRRPECASKALC